MDPRHDPRVKRDKREAARVRRIEDRRQANLHRFSELRATLCLGMMERSGKPDEFVTLVQRHIELGFPIDPSLEKCVRKRVNDWTKSTTKDLNKLKAELLKGAITILRNDSKRLAQRTIEIWDLSHRRTEWLHLIVKLLLQEAHSEAELARTAASRQEQKVG